MRYARATEIFRHREPVTMSSRRDLIETALRHLAPRIPRFEFVAILDHAQNSSGLAKASPETAAWLSLVAIVRHASTDYDDLLTEGYDVESARFFVRDAINEKLLSWGARRMVPDEEDEAPRHARDIANGR